MLLCDHTEQQISLGCDVNCDLQIIQNHRLWVLERRCWQYINLWLYDNRIKVQRSELWRGKWPTWFMRGRSHADFALVSQQHGTSHCIGQYHIILIREMCWKAISSPDKWPSAQQKPEESHLCWQRLCHEKSLILNPSTCHLHSKGSPFQDGSWRAEKKGLQRGSVRDTQREGGTGVTPVLFRQKRGLWRGRQRQPSLLLADTMWSSPLPLFSFTGALFHMQTVAVAPTCLAKHCIQTGRAEKRRRGDRGLE